MSRTRLGTMRRSAGLLLYRRTPSVEVLLVHPGGPFFGNKDVWGIPKGEYAGTEPAVEAAYREFAEETGFSAPEGEPIALGEVTQKGRSEERRVGKATRPGRA